MYLLHGQTGGFTVWANGAQNSELVNFIPESWLSFFKNQFHLPKNGLDGLKLVSKKALSKWNTNFRLEYSVPKNTTTLLPEIFRWNDPKGRVPFTFQPDIRQTFCEWYYNKHGLTLKVLQAQGKHNP